MDEGIPKVYYKANFCFIVNAAQRENKSLQYICLFL